MYLKITSWVVILVQSSCEHYDIKFLTNTVMYNSQTILSEGAAFNRIFPGMFYYSKLGDHIACHYQSEVSTYAGQVRVANYLS